MSHVGSNGHLYLTRMYRDSKGHETSQTREELKKTRRIQIPTQLVGHTAPYYNKILNNLSEQGKQILVIDYIFHIFKTNFRSHKPK